MTKPRTPSDVADEIAEAVRTLIYMTGASGSVELENPADLSATVGNLKIAAERLPQLFDQMARWIASEHAAGRVAHDRGSNADEYVRALVDSLQRAGQDATTLGAALWSAHEAASSLKTAGGIGL